MFFA
jgi:hypothetical protein